MTQGVRDRWFAGFGSGVLKTSEEYNLELQGAGGWSFALGDRFYVETGPVGRYAPQLEQRQKASRWLGGWRGGVGAGPFGLHVEVAGGMQQNGPLLRAGIGPEVAGEFELPPEHGFRVFIRPEVGVGVPGRAADWVVSAGFDFYGLLSEPPRPVLPPPPPPGRVTIIKPAPPDPAKIRAEAIARLETASAKAERETRFGDALRVEKDLRDKDVRRPARVLYLEMMRIWIEQEGLSREGTEDILNGPLQNLAREQQFAVIIDGLDLFLERVAARLGPEGEKTYTNTLFILRDLLVLFAGMETDFPDEEVIGVDRLRFNGRLEIGRYFVDGKTGDKRGRYPGVVDGLQYFTENIYPHMQTRVQLAPDAFADFGIVRALPGRDGL